MTINEAFKILGVSKNSSDDEIKKAYKKLALENHPDRFTDEKEKQKKEEKFKKINEAYQAISQKSQIPDFDQSFSGFPSGFPFNINDFFGGPAGFDFSGPAPRRDFDPRDKNNLVLNITLTFEEILKGTKKEFEIVDYNSCSECNGNPFKDKETCSECGGTGFVVQKRQFQQVQMISKTTCQKCYGNGFTAKEVCKKCNGTGVDKVIKKYVLNIPKAEEISEKK
jgi:molecular chaperone DnaJ